MKTMIKNISGKCAVALCGLMLVACSDDENVEESFSIVEATTTFSCAGGTNTLTASNNIVEAYASDDWLSLEADGATLSMTAESNPSNESRHTILVVKASALDSTIVSISQLGMVFIIETEDINLSNDGEARRAFAYKGDLELTTTTSASWLSTTVTADSLIINIAENNSGHMRGGKVYYACGNVTGEISVSQYEMEKDIPGNYYFYGQNPYDTSETITFEAQLSGDESGMTLYFPEYDLSLAATYDASDNSLNITSGRYMGSVSYAVSEDDPTVKTRYVWSVVWDTDNGYLTWVTSAGLKGTFEYSEEVDGNYLAFEDDGGWQYYQANCFVFRFFTSKKTCTSSTMVQTGYTGLASLLNPCLISMF